MASTPSILPRLPHLCKSLAPLSLRQQPTAPAPPPRPPHTFAATTVIAALPSQHAAAALASTAPSSRTGSLASAASLSAASLPSSHPVAMATWASREGLASHPLDIEEPQAAPAQVPVAAAAAAPTPPHTPAALTAEAVRVVSVTPVAGPRGSAKVRSGTGYGRAPACLLASCALCLWQHGYSRPPCQPASLSWLPPRRPAAPQAHKKQRGALGRALHKVKKALS